MAKDPADLDLTPLTAALSKLTEDMARKMVQEALPGLVEKAIAEEKVLITETVQEVARKVAHDVVGEIAETEVKKEIARLSAEA